MRRTGFPWKSEIDCCQRSNEGRIYFSGAVRVPRHQQHPSMSIYDPWPLMRS